ncbi:MEMO1 family [Paraphysoderma sedebokerense]|nr:MEMO1 family [Paraphysoderma sedebokerense]
MIRCATHAGSWYQDKDKVLSKELDEWLSDVTSVEYLDEEETRPPIANVKAIIAPERVFILGPSHHSYLTGCALTACSVYETPLGDLKVDEETIAELKENGRFDTMSLSVDEDEHSIEMHLPYIHKIMSRSRGEDFSIVPILVGATSPEKEKYYAEILLPYFLDPTNFIRNQNLRLNQPQSGSKSKN